MFRNLQKGRAFSLIELLVVIGIIAVIIAILTGVVGAARDRAVKVRCLGGLNQIGQAFSLYAANHKGVMPMSLHWFTPSGGLTGGARTQCKRWYDYLSPYLGSEFNADGSAPEEWINVKDGHPLKSCEKWTASASVVGLSMNAFPYNQRALNGLRRLPTGTLSWLVIGPVGGADGTWSKASQWKSPDRRILVIESVTSDLQLTSIWPWWGSDIHMPQSPSFDLFSVDFRRHPSRFNRRVNEGDLALNALYADGHTATISAKDAYVGVIAPDTMAP